MSRIPKEIMEHMKNGREIMKDTESEVSVFDRAITLMEAGLNERPLDRDFFELFKYRAEIKRQKLKEMSTLINMVEKINTTTGENEEDESD